MDNYKFGNNMRLLLTIVVFLTISGCSGQSATTPHGTAMSLDVASTRLAELARRPLRQFATRDFGRDRNFEAKSVVVSNEKAQPLVTQIRAELGPGLLAFVGCTRSLADPPDEGSEVVVAHGNSQFDILRVAQSDAINFDMETEDLIRKLEEYHSKYGIDIFHAGTDTIEFRFITMPSDLAEFCKDLYKFCPDIVDQGVGTVEDLEKEIAKTGTVFLWWD
jgi:hypothetical protein